MAEWTLKHGPRIYGKELQLFRLLKPKEKLSVKILWEPRDLWIGLYWTTNNEWATSRIFFICLLPCLPIRIHWKRSLGSGRYL
jgi:hypothetical protein